MRDLPIRRRFLFLPGRKFIREQTVISPPRPRPCPWAALFLLAALPVSALAQQAAAPPAVTPAVPSPASGSPLALSQKEALDQRQMLDADKRLDRLVSLDVISVPLNEVLQKENVNKSADAKPDTDAKPSADKKGDATQADPERLILTASHNCENLKLQIRLNRRPLRALMTALAEMLPGTWTHTKDGYNLSLTDKAVVARAEWWRLFLGEREKALALQRQAVLAAMQTKARRRQADDPEPAEPTDHAVEEEMANQHDFFHTLPQALKEQIAANLDDSPFYEVGQIGYGNGGEQTGTIGWLGQMSPQTQEMFKTVLQDNVSRMAREPSTYAGRVVQAQRGMATLEPSKVYFLFQNGGMVVMATPINGPPGASDTLILRVPTPLSLPVLMLDQTQLADEVYGGKEVPPSWKRRAEDARKMGDAAPPEWKQLAYEVYGMGEAAPDEWKRLAAYQRGRVWPILLPKLPREDNNPSQFVISRAAQTDWLGERGGMEYVCDYYSHGGYSMPEAQKKQPVRRPLATELDEMAVRRDVSWKKDEDGVYLVRNNRWYRDDDLEVPDPLLRRWFGALLRARRQEAAAQAARVPLQTPEERMAALKQTWDWAAEVFGALTPWQIRNGLSLFQPEEKDLAPQNDATAAKMFGRLKRYVPQPGEVSPPDSDAFVDATRRPPFWGMVNTLKGFPHTAQWYGSLDDAGRTALLAGRLPVSTPIPSQLTEAISLQPLLPQALQAFPPEAVLLRLPCPLQPTERVVFGELSRMRLEVVTPTPQSAP